MPPGKTFACQLRNSASGSIGLMCAQKILKAARIGTAKMMPTIPHIQPQNVSESRMMTGFKVRERPITHGVMKRSEERRVGKECRSRWGPDRYKKKEEIGKESE